MPERGNIASEQMFSVCRTIRLPDVAIEDDEARAIIQYLDNALRATQQAMLTLQKLRSIEAEVSFFLSIFFVVLILYHCRHVNQWMRQSSRQINNAWMRRDRRRRRTR